MRKIATALALALPILFQATLPAQAQSLVPQSQGGVRFVSGGIAEDGQQQMQAMRGQYNLHLLFAQETTGGYFADVPVRITDSSGTVLVSTLSGGPFFFAHLAPGRYTVTATHKGMPKSETAQVPATGAVDFNFYWAAD